LLLQDVADSLQIGVADSSEKGKDLPTTISLCAVMDALEEQNDQCTSSPDPGTGETFLLRVEESRMIKEGYDEQSLPEWQLDLLDQTREVLKNRRCLRLTSCFEVHEWQIMERFADVQWNHPKNIWSQASVLPIGKGVALWVLCRFGWRSSSNCIRRAIRAIVLMNSEGFFAGVWQMRVEALGVTAGPLFGLSARLW